MPVGGAGPTPVGDFPTGTLGRSQESERPLIQFAPVNV
jgi:hypothetical protein